VRQREQQMTVQVMFSSYSSNTGMMSVFLNYAGHDTSTAAHVRLRGDRGCLGTHAVIMAEVAEIVLGTGGGGDEGAKEGLVYFDRAFHHVPLRAG